MQLYRQKIFSGQQLKRLAEHKYSCQSESLLDPWLQPWWTWLVNQVPIWLAPNLITLIGLAVNVATSCLVIWYAPDARTEPPRWACALCALGLFIYQSLDAIDGKQARRTNTSSPLGELFDHGCDSISTVFVAASTCICVQLGYHPPWMFFQCFMAFTLFYCAHWQTYVSGTLRFGKIDVTEAQYCVMGVQLTSAIFGASFWTIKVVPESASTELVYFLPVLTLVVGTIVILKNLSTILSGGVGKNGSTVAIGTIAGAGIALNVAMCAFLNMVFSCTLLVFCRTILLGRGCGKNGSSIAGTSVLSPVIPLLFVIAPAFIIYRKSVENTFENHPVLYIISFGLIAAKITNKLVVAHMSRSEMQYMDVSFIGPAMLFFNQYFNTFFPEAFVLWLCFIWVTIDLMRYSCQICMEFCDYLHIHLLKIPVATPITAAVETATGTNGGAVVPPLRHTTRLRSKKH